MPVPLGVIVPVVTVLYKAYATFWPDPAGSGRSDPVKFDVTFAKFVVVLKVNV